MSDRPDFRAIFPSLVREQALPVHKFGHQPRLYQLCCHVGEGLEYDDDVVFAGAWLHDLGVFEGNRPSDVSALETWDHVAFVVQRLPALIRATNFPEWKLARLVTVVEEHQPHNSPTSIEAMIVRDADILEQLGAIAVLRTAAKLAKDTRFHHFADVYQTLRKQLTLLDALQLPRARDLARPRVRALKSFLVSLESEAGDNLG